MPSTRRRRSSSGQPALPLRAGCLGMRRRHRLDRGRSDRGAEGDYSIPCVEPASQRDGRQSL
jgi:hypothetical protein